jgi:predicted dehydrogenase
MESAALAKRHALCEKPLAVTAAEAAEMVAICARQSVLLSAPCFISRERAVRSRSTQFPYEHERVLSGRVGHEKIQKTFPLVDEFRPQIEAFSLAIRGGPLPPSCGVDGYIDMAIIEALYLSATPGAPQDVKVIPSS